MPVSRGQRVACRSAARLLGWADSLNSGFSIADW